MGHGHRINSEHSHKEIYFLCGLNVIHVLITLLLIQNKLMHHKYHIIINYLKHQYIKYHNFRVPNFK